jgi:hypothetical protein
MCGVACHLQSIKWFRGAIWFPCHVFFFTIQPERVSVCGCGMGPDGLGERRQDFPELVLLYLALTPYAAQLLPMMTQLTPLPSISLAVQAIILQFFLPSTCNTHLSPPLDRWAMLSQLDPMSLLTLLQGVAFQVPVFIP